MPPVLTSSATREEAAEQSQSPTPDRPVKGYEGERASALSPSASIARHYNLVARRAGRPGVRFGESDMGFSPPATLDRALGRSRGGRGFVSVDLDVGGGEDVPGRQGDGPPGNQVED